MRFQGKNIKINENRTKAGRKLKGDRVFLVKDEDSDHNTIYTHIHYMHDIHNTIYISPHNMIALKMYTNKI